MSTGLAMTLADLLGLLDRSKKALCEGGRPDLAERASVRIMEGPVVTISFHVPVVTSGDEPHPIPEVDRMLALDPIFEKDLG